MEEKKLPFFKLQKKEKNEANTRPIHDLKFRPESILTLQIPIFRLVSLC